MTLASFFVPSCLGGIPFPFVVLRPSSFGLLYLLLLPHIGLCQCAGSANALA
jgi:hypothetical protein